MTPEDLCLVLQQRGGFETVERGVTDGQLRLIGRVAPNASQYWILVIHHLLVISGSATWVVDISRQYFLRQLSTGPKLFYAWRLIFQAPQINEHIPHIMQTIQATKRPSHVELTEFPLFGAGLSRTQTVNGKGVGSVDRVPLGPQMAAATMSNRMGGR